MRAHDGAPPHARNRQTKVVYDSEMRAPPWFVVLGFLTWLAGLALAQPGGGGLGPQRPPARGCDVSWHTFVLIGGVLVVVFIAGAVSRIRKGKAQ